MYTVRNVVLPLTPSNLFLCSEKEFESEMLFLNSDEKRDLLERIRKKFWVLNRLSRHEIYQMGKYDDFRLENNEIH